MTLSNRHELGKQQGWITAGNRPVSFDGERYTHLDDSSVINGSIFKLQKSLFRYVVSDEKVITDGWLARSYSFSSTGRKTFLLIYENNIPASKIQYHSNGMIKLLISGNPVVAHKYDKLGSELSSLDDSDLREIKNFEACRSIV